jgi:hypothetical protein
MQKHHPLSTGLALLFLAFLLGSLTARFWATDRSVRYAGPTHLAADSQQVFLFASDNIYHLSAQGELLAQYPAEVTGMTDVPIDMRIIGDDRLLIAGQQPARIRSCDTSDWDCRDIGYGRIDEPKRQFKVLVNSPRHSLLFTDAHGDSLWGQDGPDSEAARLLPDKTLAGPNDLAFDSQGRLWIADTDHRRIVEFLPAADGGFEIGREHSAMNELTRDKRYYPIMLALGGDGNWWVTQAAEFSDRYADLVVYDPDQGAVKQVTLPGSVFATDIAATGADILVTDLEQFAVYRVDTGSYEVGIFGDDRFRDAMSRIKQEHERYRRISELAMVAVIAFGVLMVLAAVIATPKDRRWTPVPGVIDMEAAPQAVPNVRGIYWLNRNPKIDRSLKWLELLGSSLIIVTLVGGTALYGWVRMQAGVNPGEELQEKLNVLGLMFLLSGLLMAAFVSLVWQSVKAMKRRLGTDGKQLYIRLNDGREITVPPAELAFTNQVIFYQKYSIPLQTGKWQNLYEDGEVETWIVPLLRQAEKLSQMRAILHQWRHRDALRSWSLFSVVVLGLLLILLVLQLDI